VGRAAVTLFVLLGLVASGFQFVHRLHPKHTTPMESSAGREASDELTQAGDQLYLTYKWAQTYDGPDLKNFRDLQLVRADDFGFCIQVVKDGDVFRLVGPGGKPEPGRCQ
jgi:hypothetical protein